MVQTMIRFIIFVIFFIFLIGVIFIVMTIMVVVEIILTILGCIIPKSLNSVKRNDFIKSRRELIPAVF